MNANAKKVSWFVGTIVVVLLLSNVEAQNTTTAAVANPTPVIAPSPTTQVVPSTSVVIIDIKIYIYASIRITSVAYDDVKDLTKGAGSVFKTIVERNVLIGMQQIIPSTKSCVVTKVRSGSVIVDIFCIAVFDSEAEVKKTNLVKEVTDLVKTGPKIGSYTTDPNFEPNVTTMREGVTTTAKPPITGACAITAMVGVVVSCLGLYYLF